MFYRHDAYVRWDARRSRPDVVRRVLDQWAGELRAALAAAGAASRPQSLLDPAADAAADAALLRLSAHAGPTAVILFDCTYILPINNSIKILTNP